MITTRREVNVGSGSTEIKTDIRRVATVEPSTARSTEIEVSEVPVARPVARVSAPAEAVPARVSAPMDAETMMPLVKNEQKAAPVEEEVPQEKQRLSSKAKFMVGVYAATALILAIIVLATGLAISGTSAEVASLENSVLMRTAALNESDATLAHLSDEVTITGEATELGMVKSGDVTEIDLLPLGEVAEYEARTNAFDRFCDFLSKIIGG